MVKQPLGTKKTSALAFVFQSRGCVQNAWNIGSRKLDRGEFNVLQKDCYNDMLPLTYLMTQKYISLLVGDAELAPCKIGQ